LGLFSHLSRASNLIGRQNQRNAFPHGAPSSQPTANRGQTLISPLPFPWHEPYWSPSVFPVCRIPPVGRTALGSKFDRRTPCIACVLASSARNHVFGRPVQAPDFRDSMNNRPIGRTGKPDPGPRGSGGDWMIRRSCCLSGRLVDKIFLKIHVTDTPGFRPSADYFGGELKAAMGETRAQVACGRSNSSPANR